MTASKSANRVRVACPCGKNYRCRPDVLGKMFRCRACGDSIMAVEAKRRKKSSTSNCPECREEMLVDAEFCMHCGYDAETGQNLFAPAAVTASTSRDSPDEESKKLQSVHQPSTHQPNGGR